MGLVDHGLNPGLGGRDGGGGGEGSPGEDLTRSRGDAEGGAGEMARRSAKRACGFLHVPVQRGGSRQSSGAGVFRTAPQGLETGWIGTFQKTLDRISENVVFNSLNMKTGLTTRARAATLANSAPSLGDQGSYIDHTQADRR